MGVPQESLSNGANNNTTVLMDHDENSSAGAVKGNKIREQAPNRPTPSLDEYLAEDEFFDTRPSNIENRKSPDLLGSSDANNHPLLTPQSQGNSNKLDVSAKFDVSATPKTTRSILKAAKRTADDESTPIAKRRQQTEHSNESPMPNMESTSTSKVC